MTQVVEAIFDGTVFRPTDSVALPSDVRYRLTIESLPTTLPRKDSGDLWSLLRGAAGSVEAPEDWSEEHDHYLYGTAKRKSVSE